MLILGLRLALVASFLSAVADRLGWLGPNGKSWVSWGDMQHFREYTHQLVPFVDGELLTILAWAATAAELTIAVALLVGIFVPWTGLAAGVLLATFALAMTVSLGPSVMLAYSVTSAMMAAFALAHLSRGGPVPFSLDSLLR